MKNVRRKSSFIKRVSYFITALLMVVTFGSSTAKVLALDSTFYSLNDIVFFNPDDCSVGQGEADSSGLVGNDNVEKTLRYLVGKGMELKHAAGIVGNLGAESGLNPAIIQGIDTDGSGPDDATPEIATSDYTPVAGVGFGIAQWTSGGRQDGLVALSESSNRDIIDLGLQLDYLWQELSTSYKEAYQQLIETETAADAAVVFHDEFENSADSDERVRSVRGGGAANVFTQFRNIIPDGTEETGGESLVCSGNGEASAFVDGFAIYNQNDPQWSQEPYGPGANIGTSGCGPSAMAMIITALTGQTVTPLDTAVYGRDNVPTTVYIEDGKAAGSYHNVHQILGDRWGLQYTYVGLDIAKINEGLRAGGLVIMAGRGSAPFTGGGHFIVIRGVTANNMWLVGDSNNVQGIENSKKEYDPVYITSMNGSGYSWLLTK